MTSFQNPFDPSDATRHALWERLIRADIEAFLAGDWSAIEDDFDAASFWAIDAGFSRDPSDWGVGFPDLTSYRDRWLRMSAQTKQNADPIKLRQAVYEGVRVARIDFYGDDMAIFHKIFDGKTPLKDGTEQPYAWQSVFTLKRIGERWKIVSFVGYVA